MPNQLDQLLKKFVADKATQQETLKQMMSKSAEKAVRSRLDKFAGS